MYLQNLYVALMDQRMNNFIIREKDYVCDICIAQNAPKTAITAAGEFIRCLSAQCGRVPGVRYGMPKQGEICLGAHSDDCTSDELRIEVRDKILWVDGGKRGILYGVYELLEQLGFRFLAEDCEVFPKGNILQIPKDTSISQKPVFEYRYTNWLGAMSTVAPKMRLNGWDGISEMWGGAETYEGFVHTLGNLAEMEGDVTDRQPCLTDEKVFQTVVKNLRRRLKENPKAAIASVSQNDSHEWGRGCTCPACSARNEEEGTPMGSLLHFVNRVAETLEPEFPEVAFDTLSYRYTRKPPVNMQARDNVIIRLCSIECCFSHPITECDQSTEKVEDGSFADCLREWKKHSKRIYIWDYTTNFWSHNSSFPNFAVLRKNVRFFAENNVRGVFEQGNCETKDGEFGSLRTYLLSKLLWDPYMSEETYQRHMDEFLEGYYGAGAPMMRRFLERLQAAVKDEHFGIYYVDPTAYILDTEVEGSREEKMASFLRKGREDFAEALKVAEPIHRVRIQKAEIQLDLYEWYMCSAMLKSLTDIDPMRKEAEAALYTVGANLYAHMVAHGVTRTREYAPHALLDAVPNYMSSPSNWDEPRRE